VSADIQMDIAALDQRQDGHLVQIRFEGSLRHLQWNFLHM
jgi:hypothetical protein